MSLSPLAFDLISALVSFAAVLLTGKPVIAWLGKLKMRQTINTDAPKSHGAKQGTPTMGGVLFPIGILASLIVMGLTGQLPQSKQLWSLEAVAVVFLLHLLLGFLDDYLKATRGKSLGLKARQKLAGQILISVAFCVYLFATAQPGLTTVISLWHGYLIDLGWGYYALVFLLMIGMSNFTNLTDGLDGLAAGVGALAVAGIAYSVYTGVSSIGSFGFAFVGALIGFLWFNINPAKVFMGDTGSLAIGSTMVAMAVLGKQELPLFVYSLVFVAEGLSVLIQVISFKISGKRVFKMAPIHHHFELIGWSETTVVFRFWTMGVVALLIGLLTSQLQAP